MLVNLRLNVVFELEGFDSDLGKELLFVLGWIKLHTSSQDSIEGSRESPNCHDSNLDQRQRHF